VKYRRFGRLGWEVSEIGYGMWGMGGWTGSRDDESLGSLQRSIDLGCNFFDTAWAYGRGRSEKLLGKIVKNNRNRRIYTATKIPPKNRVWPATSGLALKDCYPADHVEEYVYDSLKNAGLEAFSLVQFHTWRDDWLAQGEPFEKLEALRQQGLMQAIGLSLNDFEPWNGVRAIETGKVDAVQVIYNIFDQNPDDELFPACKENDIAVIARVPFDEGSLTGTLTNESKWPEGDFRNTYFNKENLIETVARVDQLVALVPEEMTLPDMALRFILTNDRVSTVIPGMRKIEHVEANVANSDAPPLKSGLMERLRANRWVRTSKPWPA
jgi:aryl-alcohol dehydrogenase-like predicted oxidoreductase